MKTLSALLFLFLLNSSNLSAQNFAPAGSEWYHSMADGAFHSYYNGDTVIDGIASRKIKRVALTADPEYSLGLRVNDLVPLCIYNNTDTVFVYNKFFHRFTPLYVFNVHDGDTITLPILPMDGCSISFANTDSVFSFVVDSVRMKLYDTVLLKTVYPHPLGNVHDSDYVYTYSWWYQDTLGAYAERIGSIALGFMPIGQPAICPLSLSVQLAGSIRCYNDPILSIKLVPGICGIPPVGISSAKQDMVSVYPNPASDILYITNTHSGTQVHITDIAGRTLNEYIATGDKLTIPVTNIPAGAYILMLRHTDGSVVHRKIFVVR